MRKLVCSLLGLTLAATVAWAGTAAYEPDANAARADVPRLYRWDLTPLFAGDDAWSASMKQLSGELSGLAEYVGQLGDPSKLEKCLALYFDLHNRANYCSLYASLKLAVAVDDDQAHAMEVQSLALMDELMQGASFIRRELLAIDDATMAKAYEAQPALVEYRSYIDNLRRRRSRVLGAESERILGLMGDNLWAEIDLNEIPSGHENTFRALLTDIRWPVVHDADGNEVQMTLASYPRFRASPNREVRKEAVTAFFATLRQYQHAFAATLNGQYQFDVSLARARGYATALDAYLDKDALTPAVYDNLIDTVNANLEPLHRYMNERSASTRPARG
jgi:oligoendopeptidase F